MKPCTSYRAFALALALAMGRPSLFAQQQSAIVPPSPRAAALGGFHAAAAVGFDAIFENPAGFANPEPELSVSRLTINLSGPIFDIASIATSGSADIMAALPSLLDPKGRLYISADMAGPLAFGYVGKGLGFGLFNRTILTLDAASLLSATMELAEEILLTGGYAHRFTLGDGNFLDLGIQAKGFARTGVVDSGSALDVVERMTDPAALDTALPFVTVTGLGLDLGLRWTTPIGLSIGLVGRDAYSPALMSEYSSFADFRDSPSATRIYGPESVLVPADISFGLLYEMPFAFLDRIGARLVVMLDYLDILDLFAIIPRNPILNVSAGAELVLLDILSLRAGIKDALPSAGFGIDLSACTFSLAMYGRELGLEPGSRPVYNLLVSLDFSY